MDLGAILLLLGVLIVVALFVSQPFTRHWRLRAQISIENSTLLAERERALSALQELDFDYGIGKVPAEEYSAQRLILVQKGSDILRRLDEIERSQSASAQAGINNQPSVGRSSRVVSDDDLEDDIAKRRAARRQKTAGFCPHCGKPILQSDQFCPSCGRNIK
jgi:hypothetical protein